MKTLTVGNILRYNFTENLILKPVGLLKKTRNSSFTELSKLQLYLWMHGIFIGLILLYQGLWLFSKPTVAECYTNVNGEIIYKQNSGTIVYNYKVDGIHYSDYTTRNEAPLSGQTVEIQYLTFWPSMSRVNDFNHKWLGFMIGYAMFFAVTSIIFFIPNPTMPRHSYFYFTKQKPFIHMIVK